MRDGQKKSSGGEISDARKNTGVEHGNGERRRRKSTVLSALLT